jgi:hypothetical protein
MSGYPVRLITMAWGEKYVDELVSLTLPALLAPNNLPALARLFPCELVIVTEARWFERLRQHPVSARLGRHCTLDLRPIDDLVNQPDAYGMTLTYALFRGFEELGPAMVDRQLIFFNADFMLADGSLRTVGEKIAAGERLILAPSYCVVSETVTPWLAARKDHEHGVLAVAPRDMAEAALRHRHNTIRGKTVNQRAFSVEWMDQFYWLVDERTLIGHQLPFAVVSMRPERVLTEMRTYWDYGIISEACPTTPRCVIADSDDFLMIELRSADTARDQLRLGWPEPKEIAGKLKQFVTKDPIELSRYTLILHSGALSPELDEAKAELDRFVEAVVAELPAEPTHWVNHPIWAYHYPRFHEARDAFLGRRPAAVPPPPPSDTGVPAHRRGPREIASQLYKFCFGRSPWFRPLHPRWTDVQPVVNALRQVVGEPVLVVSSSELPLRFFGDIAGRHMTASALGLRRESSALEADGSAEPGSGKLHIDGDATLLAELKLGEAPTRKVWIHSLDLTWDNIDSDPGQKRPPITIEMSPPAPPPSAEKYPLCILELNGPDVRRLPFLLERLAAWIRPGGKILVFHLNAEEENAGSGLLDGPSLWFDMPCRIHFAGSQASRKVVEVFDRSRVGLRSRRPVRMALSIARLAGACLAALWASRSQAVHSRRDPAGFTSFTLEIESFQRPGQQQVTPAERRAIA